jgi:hypothetical protein
MMMMKKVRACMSRKVRLLLANKTNEHSMKPQTV